ncbi:Ubiquitin_carboxyl-terminal hydrolase family protein [Hexamita inflata]|uniref:Ubiquitin_carboxyl-terminal hydrolase family protein n=1 Tax=Hexamita inflata TaxID=28002 RepID=A0ABP1H932_9EUKA
MKKNLSGLQNNGATCYLNATLQGLFNCDSARSAFLNGPNVVELLEKIEASGEHEAFTSDDQSVVSALQLLFTQMQSSIQNSLSTKKFCKSLGMTENDMRQQEDANELMKKILDKLDFASKKFDNQTGQRTHELYQKTFEGETDSVIKCTHCQNESVTKTPFTDLMLPVRKDFFHSLASMVLPEQLDGYRCENCGNTTQALRYVAVNRIPDLGCMTLQRFVMDMYGNMNKDSSPVEFPLYLDLEFVRFCNVREIGFGSSEDEMAQLFHVLLMPWLFFEVDGEKVSAKSPIATGLLENPDFVQHLVRYYQDAALMVPFANEDLPDMFLAPQFKASPPNLFALRTIVCHSGNMNYGHYYTLALKPTDAGTVMQKCNDSYVSKIEKPANMLQFISGLTKELADEGKEKELSKSMQNYKPTAGYGNTGYMYLFERCGDYPAAPVLSERVEAAILKENRDTEDQIFKKQVVVYSNYREHDMDAFADSKSAEFQFDIRNTAANLVDLAKQQLNIPVGFQFINVFIHSLKMFGDKPENNREKYLVETPAQLNLSLDELLDTGYRPRTFKLLIEFVPNDTYEPFNYQKKYFRFQQVKATEDDRLFETTVIGYNTRLEHLSSFSAGLDRTALIQEAKQLYALPADYCSRFVADSQLDLVVIKTYLSLKWNTPINNIAVFTNINNNFSLANNLFGFKPDIDVILEISDPIFFELLPTPITSAPHISTPIGWYLQNEKLIEVVFMENDKQILSAKMSSKVTGEKLIKQFYERTGKKNVRCVESVSWFQSEYRNVQFNANESLATILNHQQSKDLIIFTVSQNVEVKINIKEKNEILTINAELDQTVGQITEDIVNMTELKSFTLKIDNQNIDSNIKIRELVDIYQNVVFDLEQIIDLTDNMLDALFQVVSQQPEIKYIKIDIYVNNFEELNKSKLQNSITVQQGSTLSHVLNVAQMQQDQYTVFCYGILQVSNELHLMTNDPINQDTAILCDKTSHFITQYKTFFNSFQENQTKAHYIEFIYQDQYHRIPIYEGIKCIQIKEFFKTCLKTTIQLCSINKTSKFQMIVPDLFELTKFANLYCYKIVVDNLLK